MDVAPKISYPGDEEFAGTLSQEFTDDELAVIDLVIKGRNQEEETNKLMYLLNNLTFRFLMIIFSRRRQ